MEITFFKFPQKKKKSQFVVNCWTGEAEYTNDIPSLPGELFGALVLAPAGPGTLDSIDTSVAMVSILPLPE